VGPCTYYLFVGRQISPSTAHAVETLGWYLFPTKSSVTVVYARVDIHRLPSHLSTAGRSILFQASQFDERTNLK
jgi:hypothetical protein